LIIRYFAVCEFVVSSIDSRTEAFKTM